MSSWKTYTFGISVNIRFGIWFLIPGCLRHPVYCMASFHPRIRLCVMIIEKTEEKWLLWCFNIKTYIHFLRWQNVFETFSIYKKVFLQGEEKWYHDGIKRHLTTIRNNNTYIWYKKRIRANVSREINWMKIEKYFFRTFNFLFFDSKGESEMYTFQHQIGIPIYLEWKIGIQIIDEMTHSKEEKSHSCL